MERLKVESWVNDKEFTDFVKVQAKRWEENRDRTEKVVEGSGKKEIKMGRM